jgi:hypothetical protein
MAKTTSLEGAEIALTSSMEEPQRAAPDPEVHRPAPRAN